MILNYRLAGDRHVSHDDLPSGDAKHRVSTLVFCVETIASSMCQVDGMILNYRVAGDHHVSHDDLSSGDAKHRVSTKKITTSSWERPI